MVESDMNYLPFRIWLMVTVTLALGALVIRLAWQTSYTAEVSSLVIVILVIFLTIGINALLIYLIIKPSLKKLKSLPVGIAVTAVMTAGLIGAIIHFIRFIPSPEAALPLSVVIATLLLASAISAYLLIVWVVWFMEKA